MKNFTCCYLDLQTDFPPEQVKYSLGSGTQIRSNRIGVTLESNLRIRSIHAILSVSVLQDGLLRTVHRVVHHDLASHVEFNLPDQLARTVVQDFHLKLCGVCFSKFALTLVKVILAYPPCVEISGWLARNGKSIRSLQHSYSISHLIVDRPLFGGLAFAQSFL